MKLVIIGAGPGGYVAAIRAAQIGASVTLVEESEVGGTCLNWGCIPTKALLASADLCHRMRHAEDLGVEVTGSVAARFDQIQARKDKIVSTQVKGIRGLLKSWGVRLVAGRGRLAGPRRVEVTARDGSIGILDADSILIATGSRPAGIPSVPFDGNRILSSTDALSLSEAPKRLVVIGAGVIGCEFAFLYNDLGSEVTLVEMMPLPVATEDHEVSELLARELKKNKISLMTGVRVARVEDSDSCVIVRLGEGRSLEADKVLVSIGRAVNVESLGLETVGIRQGKRGEILVDDRMRTSVEGIYAVGDVTGGVMLAHVASKQGTVAAENIMGGDVKMSYDVIPAAVFTRPEIGSVGLRERDCVERGIAFNIGRFQYRALGKAHAMGEIAGLFKVIAEAGTDRLLGVHIIGPHASDLIHEAALAMASGVRAGDIGRMIHAHPTLSEGLMEACEDVHGMAVHLTPK